MIPFMLVTERTTMHKLKQLKEEGWLPSLPVLARHLGEETLIPVKEMYLDCIQAAPPPAAHRSEPAAHARLKNPIAGTLSLILAVFLKN